MRTEAARLDERYRRVWNDAQLPRLADFDASNDLHLEELADLLLQRVQDLRDAEAFALLIELTRARLERMAARLVNRLPARAPAPQHLVQAVLRRLWRELRGRRAPALGFLLLSHGLMEQELRRLPTSPQFSRAPTLPNSDSKARF
ncbi:MAG: hypothetical protein ACT4PU_06985 [Planctomycetota bacterium]